MVRGVGVFVRVVCSHMSMVFHIYISYMIIHLFAVFVRFVAQDSISVCPCVLHTILGSLFLVHFALQRGDEGTVVELESTIQIDNFFFSSCVHLCIQYPRSDGLIERRRNSGQSQDEQK
jgi:hypothetical protein